MDGQRKNQQTGFSLIELLVTMLILSLGMLGTGALAAGIIKGNFYSKNITSATVIAETQLEAVQNKGYTGVTTTNFPTGDETVTMDNMGFTRNTTITNNSPATNMKTVTVIVSWSEGSAGIRSITLTTIISQ